MKRVQVRVLAFLFSAIAASSASASGPEDTAAAAAAAAAACAARARAQGSAVTVLHVDDYVHGRPAELGVQDAIDAAVRSSQTSATALLFGALQEYRLASPNATAHSPVMQITFPQAHPLVGAGAAARAHHPLRIDGCGARLVVTTPRAGLCSITGGWHLSVGNLTVDYDPLPMTQGTVVAVQSATQYTLKLDAGFPSLNLPHFLESTKWIIVKDRAHPTRHKVGTLNLIQVAGWKDRKDLGKGVFDVTLNYGWPNVTTVAPKLGDPVVHLARYDQYVRRPCPRPAARCLRSLQPLRHFPVL